MRTRGGDASESARRAAWHAINENLAPPGLARVVPAVLADFWRAEKTDRRDATGAGAWAEFLAGATPATWALPVVAASVRALGGQAEFGRLWRQEWVYQREQSRFAALAQDLALASGDPKLLQLVTNATCVDESRRDEPVDGPVRGRRRAKLRQQQPLLQEIRKTHWSGASPEEAAQRRELRSHVWRRVWAHLAGEEVAVLTPKGFTEGDGAVWITATLEGGDPLRVAAGHGQVVPVGRRLPVRLLDGSLEAGLARLERTGLPPGLTLKITVSTYPGLKKKLYSRDVPVPRTIPGVRRSIEREARAARAFILDWRKKFTGGSRVRLDALSRHLCAHLLMTGWGSLKAVGFRRATRILSATAYPVCEDSSDARRTKAYAAQAKILIQRWRLIGSP